MKTKNTLWRWWAKALGEKASKCDRESDKIAIIRSVIFLTYLITNVFIISGVIRHWNSSKETQIYIIQSDEVPSRLHQRQKKEQIQASCNFL
jgi:hypothetical protein